jgi:transcriptional regulator with XRE-family HTH domain
MSVYEKIRQIRKAKGLKQGQVAEKLDMSPNGYGDIERGNSDIKLTRLEKIAEALEIKLSALFELNEKGTINIGNSDCNWYLNSSAVELEKQLLIIELKDKELAMQQREIELLKVQITQLQKINALLEKIQ